MAVEIYHTGTEYAANSITIKRGTVDDITYVGVYHDTDPNATPAVDDFTEVTLVKPGDALAEGNVIDILSLIGPGTGADLELEPGDYQRFTLVKTATESIICKPDTITIL